MRCGLILFQHGDEDMERTKFNVDKDTAKRTYDGIVFDSYMEMMYYRDVVCPAMESGELVECELQKPYELQPAFIYNGSRVRAIMYVADFYLKHKDGHIEVIDIKGMADAAALIKRKLFWHRYPEIDYKWLTHLKKFGGWIEYDECKRLRREEKKRKLKELEENGRNEKS